MTVAGFITAQRAVHGIPNATSCRALSVSHAWFYKWRDGNVSPRRARRARLAITIGQLFAAHHGKYGSPRITDDLREAGWRVSEKTVAAIMREQRLVARAKKRRKHTTRQGKGRWRHGPDRAISLPARSIASGTATAPRSSPTRASCSWTRCWTWVRAGLSGSP